jgi:lysozyme
MKTGTRGKELIKSFEGFRAIAYICPAGVPTIGYGTTRINGSRVKEGMKITSDEAEVFLEQDLKVFEDAINHNVLVEINQNQFDALVSFVYNVGIANFKKSTLLKKLNKGDYEEASNQLLRWTRAGGKVLNGLVRRREAEKELFLEDCDECINN